MDRSEFDVTFYENSDYKGLRFRWVFEGKVHPKIQFRSEGFGVFEVLLD